MPPSPPVGFIRSLANVLRHPANRGAPLAAFARVIRWQLGARTVGLPVALPLVDDMWLLARPGMHGATGNYYNGLQEYDDMAFVLHVMGPDAEFHDVGANAGSYTLLAAAAGATSIHAYEPSTDARAWLRRNVDVNGLVNIVCVHSCALGEAEGVVKFSDNSSSAVSRVLASGECISGTREVQVRTLDEFAPHGTQRPWLLKVDVEGYEPNVLEGGLEALRHGGLMAVICEANREVPDYARRDTRGTVEHLADAGFQSFRYDAYSRKLTPASPQPGANVLFIRDLEQVKDRIALAPRFRLSNGWV